MDEAESGVLHLRPSHDQVAGDLLERRALHRRHCQGSTGQTVDEIMLPRRRANKSAVALRHFSHWLRRIGSVGTRGPRGVSGARRGLRHEGRCRAVGEGKGTKERERVVGKAAGDECVFILGEGPG